MLRQRIITAIILLIVLVGVTVFAPTIIFNYFAWLILLLAAWEWGGLLSAAERDFSMRIIMMAAVVATNIIAIYFLPTWIPWLVAFIVTCWGLAAIIRFNQQKSPFGLQLPTIKFITCILLLIPTYSAIIVLHAAFDHAWLLLYALSLIFINDSAAYFTGRALGKHKLAAEVSPKKTWEGCFGGIIGGLIWSFIISIFCWRSYFPVYDMMLVSLFTLIASVIGDLFISVLKRLIDKKDTGAILPGHGGILDRIDSILTALPLFALGASLTGIL